MLGPTGGPRLRQVWHIRSNVICPGWVRTPMSEHEMDELGGMNGKNREEDYR